MWGDSTRRRDRPSDDASIRLLYADEGAGSDDLAGRLGAVDDRFDVVAGRSASGALAVLGGEPAEFTRRTDGPAPGSRVIDGTSEPGDPPTRWTGSSGRGPRESPSRPGSRDVGPGAEDPTGSGGGFGDRPAAVGEPGSAGTATAFDCVLCGEPAESDPSTFREIVREQYPELPFVRFVDGDGGTAAAAIDGGATDVVRRDAAASVVATRISNAVEQARAGRQHARAERLDGVFDLTDGATTVVDGAGVALYHSPSSRRQLGYDPQSVEGEQVAADVHPDDRDRVRATFDAVGERGGVRTVRYRSRRADGSWRWIEAVVAGGPGTAAPENGVVVTRRDVTERLSRERELEADERHFEAVFDNPLSPVALLDPDGTVVEVNGTALGLVGATAEDVAGEPFEETPWWRDSPSVDELGSWIERAAGGDPVRFSAVDRLSGGERIPVDGVIHPIRDDDGEVVSLLAAGRDVSERVEREQVLATLHEAATDVRACETVEEAARSTVEAAETVLDMDLCSVLLHDDGWLVPAAVSSGAPADGARRMAADQGLAGRTFRSGESTVVDDVSAHPDVDPAKPSYRSGVSVPLGDLGVFQAVSTARGAFDESDVEFVELLVAHTARTVERLRSAAELERQNERLAEFAALVSHDLRNPMAVAAGRIALAREGRDDRHLETAASALDRMERIVDDVLTIARDGGTVDETEPVRLGEQVRTAWGHVDTDGATLVVEADVTFGADPDRLQHVLENLLRNAIEHGGDGVTVRVGRLAARATADDGAPGDDEGGRGEAATAGFYLEDDGAGLPPELATGTLDPGATGGNGLGLTIVGRMAAAHGWTVDLTEGPTGGARFEISGVDANDA